MSLSLERIKYLNDSLNEISGRAYVAQQELISRGESTIENSKTFQKEMRAFADILSNPEEKKFAHDWITHQ